MATFHQALPNIAKILLRLQPVLQSSRRCQVPMVAFRRPKSLKDVLVHSDLKRQIPDRGCGDRRFRVRSIYPQGLNSDDFFCSRNPRGDVF